MVQLGAGATYEGNVCRRCVRAWCADFDRFERLKAGPVVRTVVWLWDRVTRSAC
jgi:hypothetical protein